jgi:predicted ATPase
MAFFRNRFNVKGFYLLDEPENALSPSRQLELRGLLGEIAGLGHAQFVVCTHSPILMSLENSRIYSFDHVPVRPVVFEETGHFKVYRDFFGGPGRSG